MDKPPPPPHVVEKRRALNEAAYCAVLRTVTYKRSSGPIVLSLLKRLRIELGISQEQHQHWQQQFMAQCGDLGMPQVTQQPVHAQPQHDLQQQQQQYMLPPQQQTQQAVQQHPFTQLHPQQQTQQQQQQQQALARQQSVASSSGRSASAAARGGHARMPAAQPSVMAVPAVAPATAAGSTAAGARNKRKASTSAADEPDIVGYRVQRWRAPIESVWRTGCITDFRPSDNHIRITYDIGTGNDWHEWVLWQQDPSLVVLTERVPLSDYGYG